MARRSIELGLVLGTLVGLAAACGTDADRPRHESSPRAEGGAAGDGSGEAGAEAPTGGTAPSGRPRTRVPENEGGMGGEPPSGDGGEGGNAGEGVVEPVACVGDPGEPPMSAVCGDGFRAAGEECDDGNASAADSCTATCQISDSLPLRPPAGGEQQLGDGRHPFAAGCAGAVLAFTERAPCHDVGTCDTARPPPPPPDVGRIGWWNLDGNGNDASGGNHTLTIEGNVTSAPGRFGLGMKFDGGSGSCLTSPIWNAARLQGTPGLTMMAWANPGQTFLCASQRTILGRGWDYLTIGGCSGPPAPNYPGLAGDIRAVGEPMMTSLAPWDGGRIVRNGWTFVAVTWDHQDIKQYVNGALGSARANPGNLNDSDPMFNIGCAVRADGVRLWPFIGTIDEVVLYDRPLSQAEISAYYVRAISESADGINLARFDRQGTFRGITPHVGEGSTPAAAANPVVSELGSNAFAAAWTDIDGDGDGLGVVLRSVAQDGALGPLVYANEVTLLSQSDPDLLWDGNSLVAAWVDYSNPVDAPDVKVRKFDVDLQPLGAEEPLATTSRNEADVALASFAGSWAAAWRSSADGMETIEVRAGQSSWTVGPFLPGAAGDRPALVELNAQRLLLVFTEGTAGAVDGGAADVPRLRGAILAAPGATASFVIAPRVSPYDADASLGQAEPNVLRADNRVYVSWRSSGVISDPLGEEIWLKEIGLTFSGIEPVLNLGLNEISLPRSNAHRAGDQRSSALVAVPIPFGTAIAAAWMDHGSFGAGASAPGPVVEFVPTPILRLAGGE